MLNKLPYIAVVLLMFVTACTKKQDETAVQEQTAAGTTDKAADRDISTATLVTIDPEIKQFDEAVSAAKKAFDGDQSAQNKTALVKAYVSFADYMQYESPVSPRQGKYHRALVEYRNALALEPGSEKIAGEIKQIEDIYRSMGRPVPGEESL